MALNVPFWVQKHAYIQKAVTQKLNPISSASTGN
mgnify:CR=1 FL=1